MVRSPMTPPKRIIIVLGVHRSGTSCTAGVLDRLGVPMGVSGLRPNSGNPRGFYEDRGLRYILKRCGRREFLHQPLRNPLQNRIELLKQWAEDREGEIVGGKLPFLCRMVPEMHAAWGSSWIAVIPERNTKNSAKSRNKWHKAKSWRIIEAQLSALAKKRDEDLERLGVPTFRFRYDQLTQDPLSIIKPLIAFCGITPTEQQIASAVESVDPKLNHHKEEK